MAAEGTGQESRQIDPQRHRLDWNGMGGSRFSSRDGLTIEENWTLARLASVATGSSPVDGAGLRRFPGNTALVGHLAILEQVAGVVTGGPGNVLFEAI